MKVLFLADTPGWIIARGALHLARALRPLDVAIELRYYTRLTPAALLTAGRAVDLVHYGSWGDLARHAPALTALCQERPVVLSIRSHRFDQATREWAGRVAAVHVVNRGLLADFPHAVVIPDGIDPQFFGQPFVVGWAGTPSAYKGTALIEAACDRLRAEGFNVVFSPAMGTIDPEQMVSYYRSLNLYVCASEAEGFSTGVMEALAMNVPVVTTRAGTPVYESLPVTFVERTPAGLAAGIRTRLTEAHELATGRAFREVFAWDTVAHHVRVLYRHAQAVWRADGPPRLQSGGPAPEDP